MPDVIDFVSTAKDLYKPGTDPVILQIPQIKFLMVDGKGAPDPDAGSEENISEFQQALGGLYGIAYSIKMAYRGDSQPEGYQNFKVPPLEALWWMEDGSEFDVAKPDKWRWTAMIRVPEFVTPKLVAEYADILVAKKKTDVYKKVRLENYDEGEVVQLTHIGSYADEGPNIEKMHAYARDNGYELAGKHHEIYFGDPRRIAPEKLKTVLRQPIRKAR